MKLKRSLTKLGKQIQDAVGIEETTPTQRDGKLCLGLALSLGPADSRTLGASHTPRVTERPLRPASRCFPHASPFWTRERGSKKRPPKGRSKRLFSLRKSRAGEGIRTLDPNLGKVRNHRGTAQRISAMGILRGRRPATSLRRTPF